MHRFTITLSDAFDGLSRLVEEFPERVGTRDGYAQSGCSYAVIENGRIVASCIIGVFFDRMGLLGLFLTNPLTASSSFHTSPDQMGACSVNVWAELEEHGITVTPDAQLLFQKVQQAQDDGQVWRLALVTGAKEAHAERAEELDTFGLIARAGNLNIEVQSQDETPLADWERDLLNG